MMWVCFVLFSFFFFLVFLFFAFWNSSPWLITRFVSFHCLDYNSVIIRNTWRPSVLYLQYHLECNTPFASLKNVFIRWIWDPRIWSVISACFCIICLSMLHSNKIEDGSFPFHLWAIFIKSRLFTILFSFGHQRETKKLVEFILI